MREFVDVVPPALRARYDELRARFQDAAPLARKGRLPWGEVAALDEELAGVCERLADVFWPHDVLLGQLLTDTEFWYRKKADQARELARQELRGEPR